MTEAQVRQKYVGILQNWVGHNESDGSFRHIIDTYNSINPLPRSYWMSYTDAWCAATISAAAIEAGYTDIIPRECSCARMITLFQQMGRWMERDDYKPAPGDIIFYDWNDTGLGDNIGAPDHVGCVEKASGTTLTVIEGNYSNAVRHRLLLVDGRYIRGYGIPDYASKVTPSGIFTVGSEVRFIGRNQYTSSYEDAASIKAAPCAARITRIREGRAHPYHLTGDGVEGWVNTMDVLDPSQKTVDELAIEVTAGLWGDNPERAASLTAAGYNAVEVQSRVNTLLAHTPK